MRLNTLFQTQMTWDESVIQQRSQELAADLLGIWHGPTGQVMPEGVTTDTEPGADPFETIRELKKSLDKEPIPSFWVGASSHGEDMQLFGNDWGSRGARYHVEVVEDETGWAQLRVSLRDTFGENTTQKPYVRAALARLALSVQQTFGVGRTEITSGELTVWLPDDSDVGTVRRALERLVALTLPVMEHALSQAKQREPGGEVLDGLVDTLYPCLPENYYFMVADIGTTKKWRRLASAQWPNTLHYELQNNGGRLTLHLDDELRSGSPEKSHLQGQWSKIIDASRAALPHLTVKGGERSSGNRWVNVDLPETFSDLELCDWLNQLIGATSPMISQALSSARAEAAS